jgi:hypothetical protein
MKTERLYLAILAVLFMVASKPTTLSAQEPFEKLFVSSAGCYARFDSKLFSFDSDLKQYPKKIQGPCTSEEAGYQLSKHFGVSLEASRSWMRGNGKWLDVGGLTADEAQYEPVAAGRTTMKVSSALVDAHLCFFPFWRKRFTPCGVIGGGIGTVGVGFNGNVNVVDPSTGDPFVVQASDAARSNIPSGKAGGSLEFKLTPVMSLVGSYDWNLGSSVRLGMKYYPFRRWGTK